jgi:peptide/nickel transport system substrate-binding protein
VTHRGTKRHRRFAWPALVGCALLLLATGPVAAQTTLTYSEEGEPNTLDPAYLRGRPTQNALRLVFDSLYHRDDSGVIIPWLATDHENPSPEVWRFHLRDDVRFHDGTAFTAHDVKFTIERNQLADSTRRIDLIDRVDVVDDHTVDIVLKEPYAAFLTRVVLWQMTSAAAYEELGADGFASQAIGTGPFKLVSWDRGERLVFEANDDYFLGRPAIDRVVFRPIPETGTRLAALEAGDIDIAANVPPEYTDVAPPDVDIVTVSGTRVFYLGMNIEMAPFDDVRVRRAMNYAVDVEEIAEALLYGFARPIDGPLFPAVFGHKPTPVYSYEPETATALLEEAGFASGFEFTLDVAPILSEVAEAVAGQLARVGISASVNVMEINALYDKYEPGGSQAFLTSWGNSELDADATLARNLWSERVNAYTNYSNPVVDELIERGAVELDPDTRARLYHDALDIIVADAPWVFLYTAEEVYAKRQWVDGWTPRSDALINLLTATISR